MATTERNSDSSSSCSSGLDFEETELKLALPGGERKRGFSDTVVQLTLGNNSNSSSRPKGAVPPLDHRSSVDSEESKVADGRRGKQPAAKAQVVGWPPVRSFRKNVLKSCKYVKVVVDGAPYLRKVDLELYCGYEDLLTALEEMFSCFTIRNYPDERRLVDQVKGMEYVPTYEDKEGDWMLVGDVPWKMFVESCKRLRLMKRSEAVNLAPMTP